jgi:hypothetical protein
MITRPQLEEHWVDICHAVRSRWPTLGGEELQQARHSVGHFVGLIQQRTGESREDAEKFLDSVVCPVSSLFGNASRNLERTAVPATGLALGAGFLAGMALTRLLSSSRG